MTMMITRNDNNRMRSSVRNISRENFDKYLQMFDNNNTANNTISFKPKQPKQQVTNLIYQNNNSTNSTTSVKLNRMFYGVSDETTDVLNTLCNKNEEIASFLVNNNNNEEEENDNNYQWYQAVPINTTNNNDELSMIDDSINNSDDDYDPESKFQQRRLMLNEADFSDDSYDETDAYSNQGFEIKLSLLKLQQQQQSNEIQLASGAAAPIKPKRTFEHDIYVEKKNLLTLDNKNFKNNNKRLSLNNNAERRILKLIQTNSNNNDHIYETLPAVKLNKEINSNNNNNNNNPYMVLMRNTNLDTKKKGDDDDEESSSNNKAIALSEPNLSVIGKRLAKKKAPPLGRLLNQLRKTISRKSLSMASSSNNNTNTDQNSSSASESISSSSNNSTIKTENNINFNYLPQSRIKSHIYSDVTEMIMIMEKTTLFDYALIVGLNISSRSSNNNNNNKSLSVDELNNRNNDYMVNKLNPIILWQFPENVIFE